MPLFGDNPFDDGLDFVGCPPRYAKAILPDFPRELQENCRLIRWARCPPASDGARPMHVTIKDFGPRDRCGVYSGIVQFADAVTGDIWYAGELTFYYTRNFVDTHIHGHGEEQKAIAFRFVVKGDIRRVPDKIPGRRWLILCTKREESVRSYDDIFVYGGLDILCDLECKKVLRFRFSLGHNDGWYTHHPNCSARPINWSGMGDYVGHYCERGWLFVAPGRNFVFAPGDPPPTGRFVNEAIRGGESLCYTEEAIRYGEFRLMLQDCIHFYQKLYGMTECDTQFTSAESCQGLVYSNRHYPWMTFFSMGYWMDPYEKREQILHLAEGKVRVDRPEFEEYAKGLYFYGLATQDPRKNLKLVDLASNKDLIGAPAETYLLIYLYNAGRVLRDPKVREPTPIDRKLARELLRESILNSKERPLCPFVDEPDTPVQAK